MAAFDCALALAQYASLLIYVLACLFRFIPRFEELAGALSEALRSNIPPPSDPDSICYIKPEPFGVVLAIPPWNGPLCLSCRAVATPIIAGNTVVLKTSEYSPKTNSVIAQVLVEAGLPPVS
ncbi:hypothetical protein BS47DRAFT_1041193 [Hydnum rufescens UP504]|uniref:Aldehyde dehydrogenase domain-containing protein n=1 Tax=Hydnum rufescens UP504 TaxID=1448309 RepID=A0A9P6AXM3_9AGAM|nr:hypothetical protein BS47DRAFT_1041193 [Hydnum rufescens UP504]